MASSPAALDDDADEFDVVVIGSGIGGLSAAATCAASGLTVAVCESHDALGGAAHEWTVNGFHFESGPSLYAGLSPDRSPNPLKHVFQIIGEEPEWLTYDRWGTYLPEGAFAAAVGADDFMAKLDTYGGPDAREQWERLLGRVTPLGEAIFALPSAAVRADAGAAITMGRYAGALGRVVVEGGGNKLNDPFRNILTEERITDQFILNWLDMICFLLQGATTADAPTTLSECSRTLTPAPCFTLVLMPSGRRLQPAELRALESRPKQWPTCSRTFTVRASRSTSQRAAPHPSLRPSCAA